MVHNASTELRRSTAVGPALCTQVGALFCRRDIQLPPELELSQGHGKVSWSVRAAWEIVAGWYYYDTIANLYHVPPSAVHADLVDLAGGPDPIADRARRYLRTDQPLEAIRLLDVVAGNESRRVLQTRIEAVEQLLTEAREGLGNYSEIGLLQADLRASRKKLAALGAKPGARRE